MIETGRQEASSFGSTGWRDENPESRHPEKKRRNYMMNSLGKSRVGKGERPHSPAYQARNDIWNQTSSEVRFLMLRRKHASLCWPAAFSQAGVVVKPGRRMWCRGLKSYEVLCCRDVPGPRPSRYCLFHRSNLERVGGRSNLSGSCNAPWGGLASRHLEILLSRPVQDGSRIALKY
ncbi:hypothetical protein CH63R_13171 [Colletotrichum higginsianum IMI 349063]|uniref:Uncharacterized protein n=1 Tax=Colletotrichum higginsianum (strain IMI 349063) TaxID=759273 RepID=A0A1B7XWB7_COLHI|nr:hypothetical protein CH63R_13171 [Colletotrichum higginsianum IMI 349063]OBR04044.1 hypothetical protein CH63R_13171 [Colletotrichum higginsianum IMI 349063]